MNELLNTLVNFQHWEFVGIPLSVLFFIVISLEMAGFIKPFSVSKLSKTEQQEIYTQPTSKKIKDLAWYINLFIICLFLALKKANYFTHLPYWMNIILMAIVGVMLFVNIKFLPKVIKKIQDRRQAGKD